jgi:hypothetical protein
MVTQKILNQMSLIHECNCATENKQYKELGIEQYDATACRILLDTVSFWIMYPDEYFPTLVTSGGREIVIDTPFAEFDFVMRKYIEKISKKTE